MGTLIIKYRRLLVTMVHLTLWTCALGLSVMLRFEFSPPQAILRHVPTLLALTLLLRSVVHWRFGLFHGLWRYSGARDLLSLLKAAAISSILIAAIWAFLLTGVFPRSILVLDFAFSILMVGGFRFAIRTAREIGQGGAASDDPERRRVLVIGAGDAGESLVRELTKIYGRRYDVVGFLDDAPAKQNALIHGVPVLGKIPEVKTVAHRERIDEIIIAIPTLNGPEMRRVVERCREAGTTGLRTLPSVASLIDGRVTVSQLSEVAIEDLLGRDPIELDTAALHSFITDRVVLVTGAGGSIGSELCRQILKFRPKSLLLVEQAENALFEIHRSLLGQYGDTVTIKPFVADICDSRRVDQIFDAESPAVVFHAAAHKHVPMMEANPGEAIKNNVFGTKKLADAANRAGVESFVMVSTDKAVNPTSVMGASKRAAEIYVQALSQGSKTRFVTVRFGNVLGSAGSVIPIFQQQIKAGGPVLVTHPEMQRYFMTIPEASQLVMQAGAMGKGGEIFVLDMGSPVKIVDLARDLIRLSGLEPDEDIAIQFTGIRPGEKLFEELSLDGEKATKTGHPKIFVGTFQAYPRNVVEDGLLHLHQSTDGGRDAVVAALQELIPEYGPTSASPSPPPVCARDVEEDRHEDSGHPPLAVA